MLERLRRRARDPAWDAIVAGDPAPARRRRRPAGLLRDLAAALEAASAPEREALAATAQARFTARLVLVLPVGAAVLAELASPGLIGGLLTNPGFALLTDLIALTFQLVALGVVAHITQARSGEGAAAAAVEPARHAPVGPGTTVGRAAQTRRPGRATVRCVARDPRPRRARRPAVPPETRRPRWARQLAARSLSGRCSR